MGRHALALLSRGARILTHCNAGALATGGYGTALGVVRAAFAADPGVRVVVDETRPLLQGARLTAWELEREGIPYTLIADSMAAAMMASGRVSHVVVGADRIAANGDVVNKIGTYGVAILAREHGIPMIVAAPTTTLDPSTPSGAGVVIEERAAEEVRGLDLFGRAAAPADAGVANPAFDVTPARLVSAIVTEEGVHRPPYERSLRAALDAAAARAPSSVTPS
jgi:methylthioribose-1-phosphate isomerase